MYFVRFALEQYCSIATLGYTGKPLIFTEQDLTSRANCCDKSATHLVLVTRAFAIERSYFIHSTSFLTFMVYVRRTAIVQLASSVSLKHTSDL